MPWAFVFLGVLTLALFAYVTHRMAALVEASDAITKRLATVQQKDRLLDRQLEAVAQLTMAEAQRRVYEKAEQRAHDHVQSVLARAVAEAARGAEVKAEAVIVGALGRVSKTIGIRLPTETVTLPSPELKRRIIGKGGTNVAVLQDLTGVDVVVEEHRNTALLTSWDPYRRFLAKRTIERLLEGPTIWPSTIKKAYREICAEVGADMVDFGEDVARQAQIEGLSQELLRRVGMLSFRSVQGRSLADIAAVRVEAADSLARELDVDATLARRAALLCDIGFTEPLETEGNAASLGAELAAREGEAPVVCAAIARHAKWPGDRTHGEHGHVPFIVAAADTLVWATGGNRHLLLEQQSSRMRHIEEFCQEQPGVVSAQVIKMGQELRVFVDASVVSDLDVTPLAVTLAEDIKKHFRYSGVRVDVLRQVGASVVAERHTEVTEVTEVQ